MKTERKRCAVSTLNDEYLKLVEACWPPFVDLMGPRTFAKFIERVTQIPEQDVDVQHLILAYGEGEELQKHQLPCFLKDLLILQSLNSLEETIATEYIDSLAHKIQFLNHKDESSCEEEEDKNIIKEEDNEDNEDDN